MDRDDPERRIAELERQMAEQKHVAGPERLDQSPRVTADDVHNVAFSRGRRGYHEDEVDAFLDRLEVALRDPTAIGGVTEADLHSVAFSKTPFGKKGYNEEEVDGFLDLVKVELTRRRQ
jgi:DivIVA domain-containing protein